MINTKIKNKLYPFENKLILLETIEINSIVQDLYNSFLLEHSGVFNLLCLSILNCFFLCYLSCMSETARSVNSRDSVQRDWLVHMRGPATFMVSWIVTCRTSAGVGLRYIYEDTKIFIKKLKKLFIFLAFLKKKKVFFYCF